MIINARTWLRQNQTGNIEHDLKVNAVYLASIKVSDLQLEVQRATVKYRAALQALEGSN